MNIIERLKDALFAFRHGLDAPQPRTMPGPWFANSARYDRPPQSHAERYAAWLRAKNGDDVRLPIGSMLPDSIDFTDGDVKCIGPAR